VAQFKLGSNIELDRGSGDWNPEGNVVLGMMMDVGIVTFLWLEDVLHIHELDVFPQVAELQCLLGSKIGGHRNLAARRRPPGYSIISTA
jgi:hypothetical protein